MNPPLSPFFSPTTSLKHRLYKGICKMSPTISTSVLRSSHIVEQQTYHHYLLIFYFVDRGAVWKTTMNPKSLIMKKPCRRQLRASETTRRSPNPSASSSNNQQAPPGFVIKRVSVKATFDIFLWKLYSKSINILEDMIGTGI